MAALSLPSNLYILEDFHPMYIQVLKPPLVDLMGTLHENQNISYKTPKIYLWRCIATRGECVHTLVDRKR